MGEFVSARLGGYRVVFSVTVCLPDDLGLVSRASYGGGGWASDFSP